MVPYSVVMTWKRHTLYINRMEKNCLHTQINGWQDKHLPRGRKNTLMNNAWCLNTHKLELIVPHLERKQSLECLFFPSWNRVIYWPLCQFTDHTIIQRGNSRLICKVWWSHQLKYFFCPLFWSFISVGSVWVALVNNMSYSAKVNGEAFYDFFASWQATIDGQLDL